MDALGVVGLNVTLKVGGITQEVTVSATPPMLRTADGRLGQTIRNEVYTALPLVMNTGGPRDPTAFMFLMPGVQSVGRWGNVMGGQDFTNETYVEGVPITNAVVQGEGRNLSMGISVEAIDQFQVETSGTAVMYSGQGASNYVVKSGTNLFRGSAFEFFRNKGLDTQGVLRRHQAGRQPARVRLHARRTAAPQPGVLLRRLRRLSRSPADRVAADLDPDGGATQRRLQRAAGRHLRSGDDAPQPERHRLRPRSVPRQHHPGQPHLADLAQPAVLPARSLERQPAEQLSRRPPADRVQQRQRHGQGRPAAVVAAPGRGAVRARQAQPGDAVPRRRQRPDAAAAALHRDTPRRGDSDHRAGEAHLRDGLAVGQPGQPRVRAAVGADLQRHDRRPLPDRGRHHRPARRRGRQRVPRDQLRRPERADQLARHRLPRVHRVPEQLHVPGQPAVDGRPPRRDVRLPGAAHGRQRARAHLRQPGDVRLQQLADGRLHRHWHAQRGDRPPLRQLPARRIERDERHRGLGGGDQRPFPHLRLLGAGRLQGQRAAGPQPRPALRHHAAVHRGLRSLVVHEPGPAEPGRRRLPGRDPVRRLRRQQLPVQDADQDLLRQHRPARSAPPTA